MAGGGSLSFGYDQAGNLTNRVGATSTNQYDWDAENRLVELTQWTNNMRLTSQFTYDAFGRRVKIIEQQDGSVTSTKQFVWVGTQLREERDGNNAVTKRFFARGQQNITLNPQPSTLNLFYTRDHLGSIREMTDPTGTVRARYDYDPYGRRTKVTGDLDADFGYTGYYVHAASGLQMALYRAYDADLGRFINRDPIAERGGLNLYDYVENNSIMKTDPSGEYSLLEVVVALVAVGLIVVGLSKLTKDQSETAKTSDAGMDQNKQYNDMVDDPFNKKYKDKDLRGCKTLSVNCLPSIRFAPSGVRRSEGERSEPSAAEPRRGQSGSAREKLVEGGPYWFPVGVSRNTTNINTTWPTNTSLNS